MASILRIANLCKTYQISNTVKQEVLKGVDLELDSGEMVALLGESGCGKSTLIHIIGGLDTDYTGSVVIKGKFIRDFSEHEMDDYRKKRIGLIFQNYNLIPHMTLKENVEIALKMSDTPKEIQEERALELLNLVGLKSHADKMPNQLSGGQKQRVSIARALANNPSILLADEPTGALDKESAALVMSILKKISEMGKLVVVVTHSQMVAEECSRIVRMEDGVIVDNQQIKTPSKNKYEKYKEIEPKNIKTKEVGKLSLRNLISNRNRSLLVSFGISIGIAALILILALSRGLTNYVKDYYASDDASTVIMVSGSSNFTTTKISAIESLSGVSKVTESHTAKSASYTYEEGAGSIENIYETITTPEILYGSSVSSASEIVIDLDLATTLSSDGAISVIGKTIDITYKSIVSYFTIVGIYEDDSSTSAYITSNAMNVFFSTTKNTNTVYVKAEDITYIDSLMEELTNLGYLTSTQDSTASVILDYIDLGTNVLTAVAAIASVTSAIMILIVLYISVIERTQEIGILRSIGSRKKDIRHMFLLEASMLGFLGGTFAVGIALVISTITNVITNITAGYMFISYNPLYYILGFVLSIGISALAGIIPSKKASDLDPVEALRFE